MINSNNTLLPLNTTTGKCPRCTTTTYRFAADELRFEAITSIIHTPARCERVRKGTP